MSVALCSDGIISLSIISVRTSIKSSKKEPANPPSIITYGNSVNTIANANITPILLIIMYFLYFNFGKNPAAFAPNAAPSPITKSAGPSSASFNPARGSFACKKNSTRVETAPISAFITMILLAFLFVIMKCQLSVMTFLSRFPIFAFLFAFGLLFSLLSVFSSFGTDTSFRLHAIPIAMRLNTISNAYAFL